MEKGLTTTSTALDFSDAEMLKVLKNTVAVGTTNEEFQMFIGHCKGTGLNPFKKEIWCIKTPGKKYQDNNGEWKQKPDQVQIMTGINGFFAIANSNQGFDGYESGLIAPDGSFVTAAYPKADFIGAWCKVYRKDRRIPTEAIAMLSEYDKSKAQNYSKYGIWNTMKRTMIIKCAESVGLRKTFPQELNGMYTAEEMPPEFALNEKTKAGAVIVADALIEDVSIPMASESGVSVMDTQPESDVWTGEDAILMGKHKGKAWKDLSGDYVEWVFQNTKGQSAINAGLELARRDEAQQQVFSDINEQAAKAADDFDSDEIPAEFTTNKEA